MNKITSNQTKQKLGKISKKNLIYPFQNNNNIETTIDLEIKHKRGKSSEPFIQCQKHLNEKKDLNIIEKELNNKRKYNIEYNYSLRESISLSPLKNNSIKYLPDKEKKFENKKTLILDLDETLVHSSFKQYNINIPSDIIMNINFENEKREIHVLIRPGVKEFLERISKRFEIIIFTASLSKYASPLIDILDNNNLISYRLFRQHCTFVNGVFVKDLNKLNRKLEDLILLDNSPFAYMFHNNNGFPIKTWYDDKSDRELYNFSPIIEFLSYVPDVRKFIPLLIENNQISFSKTMNIISQYNNKLSIEKEKTQLELIKRGFNVNNNNIEDKYKKRNYENENSNTNNSIITNSNSSRYFFKKNYSFQNKEKNYVNSNYSTITKNTNDNSRNNSINNSRRLSSNNIKNIKVQKFPKNNSSGKKNINININNNNNYINLKKDHSFKKDSNKTSYNYIENYNSNLESKRSKIPFPKKSLNSSKKSSSKTKTDYIKNRKSFQSNSQLKNNSIDINKQFLSINNSSRINQFYSNKVNNYNSINNSRRNISLKIKSINSMNFLLYHQRNKSYESNNKNNKIKNSSHLRSKSNDKIFFNSNSYKKKKLHKKNKSLNHIKRYEEISHCLNQPISSRHIFYIRNNYNYNPYL